MPGNGNIFQAFGCRSSKAAADIGGGLHSVVCKAGDAASKIEHTTADMPTSRGLMAQQDMPNTAVKARPSKRQKPSANKISNDCVNGAALRETLDVDIDRMAAVAAADETAYMEDVSSAAADAGLSDISRKARGKEGLDLTNAKGLPERLGDKPLRLIIGGNNPSDDAWKTGHYYSHRSNRLWKLLPETGIVPPWANKAECDERVLHEAAVGFTDIGLGHPGSNLSKVESKAFEEWASGFYERLRTHMMRASNSIGCTCGECGAPAYVAWSGKRQWMELLNVGRRGKDRYQTLQHGLQHTRPKARSRTGEGGAYSEDWPLPARTQVFVCTSTSGAAPMTREERRAPWQQLSDRLQALDWPPVARCSQGL